VSLDFTEVTATDLGRHFGRRKALSQVSFECRAGEVLGLLGPNGAGKSTLISILATLLAPSTGRVAYGGRTVNELGASLRSTLGLLGHDLYLYPELTARENLLFFARLYGLSDAVSRTSAALDAANLADRGDDQVLGFSRGMRQRLALERALIHGPRLLLLDEPFTGLDQASSTALVDRLQTLKRNGCLIVLATHDLEVAEGLLSRALYLRNGRLVAQDGGTGPLRERYRAAINAS
jgi:ABC-type multidrug transport system ATPase subunit